MLSCGGVGGYWAQVGGLNDLSIPTCGHLISPLIHENLVLERVASHKFDLI